MIADGKHIANILEQNLKEKLSHLTKKRVCFVLFGDDYSSTQFIRMKSTVAERIGVDVDVLKYPQNISNNEAVNAIKTLISEKKYDGIVIQLPLPVGLDTQMILNLVPSELDIDVLNDYVKNNQSASHKIPPVARAVFEILSFYNITLTDKKIIIIGRGRLVGRPISSALSEKNISHNIIDEFTDPAEKIKFLQSADIIISGAGSPYIIKPEMVKNGVVLIDAGTSEQHGKLVGDIDPACAEKAFLITPVPGGVGPVTVVSLFMNLLDPETEK